MAVNIGVVAEGVTDQVVIEELVSAAVEHADIALIKVQPTVDRTSMPGDQEGGWRQVYKWCLGYPPDLRRQMIFGGGLFATSEPDFQLLLVHLDADLCDDIEFIRQSPIDATNFDLKTSIGRGGFIKETLKGWLWQDQTELLNDLNWTVLAPAVEKTETWLVAAFEVADNPEEMINVDCELLKIYQKISGNRQRNQKAVRKKPEIYRKIAQVAKDNISSVTNNCPHFAEIIFDIEAAITGSKKTS